MNFPAQVSMSECAPTVLSELEIKQVSGALAPLLGWALWTGGGVVVGLAAAYIATHWK